MRILIDAVAANTGGGLSRSRELARTLPALRPANEHLFAVQPAVAEQLKAIDGRLLTLVPPSPVRRVPMRLFWEHLLLPRAARAFRPDAVIAPFNIAPLGWPAPRPVYGVIVSSLAPYSEIVSAGYRGREAWRLALLRRLTDATLARADRVFLLSGQAFDLIDRRLLDGKAEVIPMAPPDVVGALDVERPTRPYVVVVGDLMRYKGVEVVLSALALVDAPARPLLVVCGRLLEPDYVHSLRRIVRERDLGADVELRGPTPHGVVLGLIRGALACVVSSRFENPGRTQVEAMALGTPVIASDIPAFRETCAEAALYFPLTEPRRLADHLRTLVRDEGARAEWGARAIRHTARMRSTDASSRILAGLEAAIAER